MFNVFYLDCVAAIINMNKVQVLKTGLFQLFMRSCIFLHQATSK